MRTLSALALAAALATAPVAFAQAPASDAHAAHHPAAVDEAHAMPESHADDTARFATDAVLREQMAGIRDAVEALAHHEMGHMTEAQAREFAVDIEARVQAIIAGCKLPPDADAVLHGIIVPLLDSAIALQTTPSETAPVAPMRAALAEYARRFDDTAAAQP